MIESVSNVDYHCKLWKIAYYHNIVLLKKQFLLITI